MPRDLAELQGEVVARGFEHDFGSDHRVPDLITGDLRLIDSVSFDLGTDPGDDVTMYLIEAGGQKGYLLLSDSFHVDPRKAALLEALLAPT